MDVSILIITYNSQPHIADCLDSLKDMQGLGYEMIVVDNASTDDTLEILRQHSQINLLANAENRGFAAAVNQAARVARGRHLFLLNPDARAQPFAITQLVNYLDKNPETGICVPRLFTADGKIRHNCFSFETPWSIFWFGAGIGPLRRLRGWFSPPISWDIYASQPQKIEAAVGAAMLVRGDLFKRLDGFDEQFFMYCEDGDFCLRSRRAGFAAVLLPQAEFFHVGGGSTPDSQPRLNGMIAKYLLQSRYLYTHKYWGSWAARLLRLANLAAGSLIWLVSFLPSVYKNGWRQAGEALVSVPLPILPKRFH